MGYFDISLDNDITYLLSEISHNVKVNNIPAKAIVNNASMERTFDDKKIITNIEIKRGDYVNYNNLFFIVLNEVNDKRYNTYFKGIIRNCNFDLKFIIDDKLYLFYSIAEGNKFTTTENSNLIMSADVITVTLPSTDTTNQIKMDARFIKWGRAWKVQGIDKTKKGLVILTCQSDTRGADDDIENEIADRYDTSNDRLNGNIEPILPFDETPVEPEPEPEPPTDSYSISISPSDTSIRYGNTITFTVEKYNNESIVDGNFEITLDSSTTASDKDYEFTTADNAYTIRNVIDSFEYVSVRIKDLDGHLEDRVMDYELAGIFG